MDPHQISFQKLLTVGSIKYYKNIEMNLKNKKKISHDS
jgi:hypothetical protein